MKTKEQPIPKWFNGQVYDKGAIVQNRFGGAEIEEVWIGSELTVLLHIWFY